MSKKGKFLLGVAAGIGAGMLLTEKNGKENRAELKKKCSELLDKLKSLDADEVKGNITAKISELQDEVKNLNKEKALGIAKEKASVIKSKADELVKYAVKKGSPAVEKAAKEVKAATVKTLKDLTAKLENDKKDKKTTSKK